MDLCPKAKLRDINVYCNCSAPSSENLEEDDYNFLNYKELYFEPSDDADNKIDSFWKYLNYQNIPLPRVNRPKIHKKIKKHVRIDETLRQNEEYKSTNWADKLAYFQEKGFGKMLKMSQKKTCTVCNNDEFDPVFADLNCRDIVNNLPDLVEKKETKCAVNIKKSTPKVVSVIEIKVPQIITAVSESVLTLKPDTKSEISDLHSISVSLQNVSIRSRRYSNWPSKSIATTISDASQSDLEMPPMKEVIHRRKKLVFSDQNVNVEEEHTIVSERNARCVSDANLSVN